MANKAKGRKGKVGKKKGQMLKYANERRHPKSHIRRIIAHLARYGECRVGKRKGTKDTDKVAIEALKVYKAKAGVY